MSITDLPRLFSRSKPVAIYTLVDPRDGAVRYVGKTTSPKDRYRQHVRSPGTATAKWIADLGRAGTKPKMDVIDHTSRWGWRRVERRWIRRYVANGAALLNIEHNPHRRAYRGAHGSSAALWVRPVSRVGRTLQRGAWAGLCAWAWVGAGGAFPDALEAAGPAAVVSYAAWSLQQVGRTP